MEINKPVIPHFLCASLRARGVSVAISKQIPRNAFANKKNKNPDPRERVGIGL